MSIADGTSISPYGRIEKNHVERSGSCGPFCAGKPSADNSIAVADSAASEVALDERHRSRIALDERHVRGAPAERFDADRPGAGESIKHLGALDARREDVEQRLAQFVGCGTKAVPIR